MQVYDSQQSPLYLSARSSFRAAGFHAGLAIFIRQPCECMYVDIARGFSYVDSRTRSNLFLHAVDGLLVFLFSPFPSSVPLNMNRLVCTKHDGRLWLFLPSIWRLLQL